jgi:hypothetical protein
VRAQANIEPPTVVISREWSCDYSSLRIKSLSVERGTCIDGKLSAQVVDLLNKNGK